MRRLPMITPGFEFRACPYCGTEDVFAHGVNC